MKRVERTTEVKLVIEITEPVIPMHKENPNVVHAALKLNGVTLYEEDVYDNPDTNPAELNLLLMFKHAIDPEVNA